MIKIENFLDRLGLGKRAEVGQPTEMVEVSREEISERSKQWMMDDLRFAARGLVYDTEQRTVEIVERKYLGLVGSKVKKRVVEPYTPAVIRGEVFDDGVIEVSVRFNKRKSDGEKICSEVRATNMSGLWTIRGNKNYEIGIYDRDEAIRRAFRKPGTSKL